MHAGSLLLKMGQHSDVQWRALSELAALCYLKAFQVSLFQFGCSLNFTETCYFTWSCILVYDENMNKLIESKLK